MPNQMTIRIDVIQTLDPNDDPTAMQTVSKFVLVEKDHVTFNNAATKSANVRFDGQSPLCQGNNQVPSFDINPNSSKTYKVCVGAGGSEFKYTATVVDAAEEDPILIVERSAPGPGLDKKPIFFPEGIPMLVIGALVGALVGYLIAKRLLTRNPRQP